MMPDCLISRKWTKLGRIYECIGSNESFFKSHSMRVVPVQLPCDNVRLFFSSRCENDMMHPTYIDVAEDNPTEILHINADPLLKLGEPGTFDDSGITIGSIIQIDGRLMVYYTGWKRRRYGVSFELSIGLAILSDDLSRMDKYSIGPIIGQSTHNPYLSAGPFVIQRDDGGYQMYYCSGDAWLQYPHGPEPIYTVYVISSEDGINWDLSTKDKCIEYQYDGEVISAPWVVKKNDHWMMYYCYRGSRDKLSKNYNIGYAKSVDGLNWQRCDKEVGIEFSKSGWDAEMMCYPAFFSSGQRDLLFYSGNGVGRDGFGVAEASST